jgi:asparagine synthase (glutamine-hydrolysing)
MCGIAGIVDSGLSAAALRERLEAMQTGLRHRGPDDAGIYISPDGRSGLAHTRLAILDLSPAGHQPMASSDGRYYVTFNGEIYNFRELRQELAEAGERFQSESDTEVVLKMYQRYGPEFVRELSGMFAFAIWDEREKSCFLARGPFGIKPLYYSVRSRRLAFASELRGLLAAGFIPRRLSGSALRGYFLFGSVQEPETLIEGVYSLPAGHYLFWQNRALRRPRCFWDVQFQSEPVPGAEAVAATREALNDTVRRHFVSDVPVSIFLSGGIDSTALVALARRTGVKDLRTFCISFDDPNFNEGEVAKRTAQHFGAEHYDWRLDSTSGKALITEFLTHLDQPSIDGFNTFCVAKHAHDHGAKVVLSGLGGDELFAGYRSFSLVPKLAKLSRWMSLVGPVRGLLGRVLEQTMPRTPHRRLGSFLAGPPSIASAYWAMRGIFTPNESLRLARAYLDTDGESEDDTARHFHVPPQPTAEDAVSYLEIARYMRNQLLRDSDVMSMAWGLELRVPFVDRQLLETLARIPAARRLAPGKRLLLEAVPEIPEWVARQPKRGFVFPFEDWIVNEWHDLFVRLDAASPVRLQSWYRRWCLLALESFLSSNKVDARRLAT